MAFDEYDSSKSIFDNLFSKKEKKQLKKEEAETQNLFLENLGFD